MKAAFGCFVSLAFLLSPSFAALSQLASVRDALGPRDIAGTPTLQERAQPSCTTALKQPTPTGFVCGVQGTESTPQPLQTFTAVASLDVCRTNCLKRPDTCLSFSYKANSKRCVSEAIPYPFCKCVVFYDQFCYKQTCGVCPAAYPDVCGGQCVDTQSDLDNCGSCGTTCPGFQPQCNQGQCSQTPFYVVGNSGTRANGSYIQGVDRRPQFYFGWSFEQFKSYYSPRLFTMQSDGTIIDQSGQQPSVGGSDACTNVFTPRSNGPAVTCSVDRDSNAFTCFAVSNSGLPTYNTFATVDPSAAPYGNAVYFCNINRNSTYTPVDLIATAEPPVTSA